ncbi:membrane-like protein [Sphingobium sp.]|uniref:COG3650 family protein n=1 Tax=Sphingobium sp. TaxID=1912891 RepID=UPI0028BEEDE9|nr:membrane-like protein [Sphingobium sp.]
MTRLWPLGFTLMMAACAGEKDEFAANSAQAQASAPIIARKEVANPSVENVSETVPRRTVTERAPSPVSSDRPTDDHYRAIGTEPFWAVTVRGSTVTLERPDKAPIRYTVSRHGDGKAIRYLGDGFSMVLTEGPCSDGMSDAIWSDRVAVAFGEGTLNGCGGVRDDQDSGGPDRR